MLRYVVDVYVPVKEVVSDMESSHVETKSDNLATWAWVLGIASCLDAIAGLFNYALLLLRVNDVFGNAQQFQTLTASWSMLNWLTKPIFSLYLLWAGMLLMRLSRHAVVAYSTYLLLAIAVTIYHALSTDWSDMVGILGIASIALGFLFYFACLICARSLQVKGRLS